MQRMDVGPSRSAGAYSLSLIHIYILTVQEYLGYLLIPSTKAQKMLVMTGKGGEGKSRIGLLLKKLFGDCLLYTFISFFCGLTDPLITYCSNWSNPFKAVSE